MEQEPNSGEPEESTDAAIPARDERERRLVTTAMLAGEALADSCAGVTPSAAVAHAEPGVEALPPWLADFGPLCEIAAAVRAWQEETPGLPALLAEIRRAFADEDLVRVLFRSLFPRDEAPGGPQGSPGQRLTPRQVEVLREAARGLTQAEIGKRLGIRRLTVRQHFDDIYQRLGVPAKRPLQAIARAIACGDLKLDDFEVVRGAASSNVGDYALFSALVAVTPQIRPEREATGLNVLAEFALFLLLAAGTAGLVLEHVSTSRAKKGPGVVWELTRQGEVRRSWGEHELRSPMAIAIAPASASRKGFTPGHLFIVHSLERPQSLNNAAVSEFTPEGRFVRSFCGGREIGTRMIGSESLVFDSKGQLLVGSDGLTDAILAFCEGGQVVRRFAAITPHQLALDAQGWVYATHDSSIGTAVRAFDVDGEKHHSLGSSGAGSHYYGLAVDKRGLLWVNRFETEQEQGLVEQWDPDGDRLRSFAVPGLRYASLTLGAEGRLYVPCFQEEDIKVLDMAGTPIGRVDLTGRLRPRALAFGTAGNCWVCGEVR